MKTFRFLYWLDSILTDCYVKADNEQEALEKFKELPGERIIVRFKEVSEVLR